MGASKLPDPHRGSIPGPHLGTFVPGLPNLLSPGKKILRAPMSDAINVWNVE